MFSMQQIILKKRYGISFSAGAMTADYLANKNDTLTGNFGFVSNKMAFTIGKLTEIKSHLLLTKAMQILPI